MPLGGAQKWWLHHSLTALRSDLSEYGMHLALYRGDASDIILRLAEQHGVQGVYWNKAVETLQHEKDGILLEKLARKQIPNYAYLAHLLCDPEMIRTKTGSIFKVFTPFWRHCLQSISPPQDHNIHFQDRFVPIHSDHITDWNLLPEHPNWAVDFSNYWKPGKLGAEEKLDDFLIHGLANYDTHRNYPALDGTSSLSPHLHFGEISPWRLWHRIHQVKKPEDSGARVFLSQMGWREFSYYLLHHFPDLPDRNFKPDMDAFPWQHDAPALQAWQKGQTGYPIVDAGMRQLWHSGTMHNRVRMIVASFLTKNLMMHWRIGAQWFMDTLLDADQANNTAGWQWVAGCGADAAPYFRIFNPILQGEKFDPDALYIKRWVPELANISSQRIHDPVRLGLFSLGNYAAPIVRLDETRERALKAYKSLK